MPLFGPKPNKVFVFIHYKSDPPTSSQQAEIMSSLSKGGTPIVFAEACQLPEEQWDAPIQLRDAYMKLQGSRYLFQNGIGTGSKLEYKTREMGGFIVTTVSGVFV
jgi:hypothetical protein